MTSPLQSRRLEVQLIADHSNLSVTELENLIGLSPDESWEAEQRYTPSPSAEEQRYQFSRWAIREVAPSLDELPETVHRLIARVQGLEDRFLLLPSDTQVSLTLFVTETDTVIGMGIDAETIRLLAKLNAGIEMSMLVSSTEMGSASH